MSNKLCCWSSMCVGRCTMTSNEAGLELDIMFSMNESVEICRMKREEKTHLQTFPFFVHNFPSLPPSSIHPTSSRKEVTPCHHHRLLANTQQASEERGEKNLSNSVVVQKRRLELHSVPCLDSFYSSTSAFICIKLSRKTKTSNDFLCRSEREKWSEVFLGGNKGSLFFARAQPRRLESTLNS